MGLNIFDIVMKNEKENYSIAVCDASLLQQNSNAGNILSSTSSKKNEKKTQQQTRTKRIHKRMVIEEEEMREGRESTSPVSTVQCISRKITCFLFFRTRSSLSLLFNAI
jgi:hypothetical protein